MQSYAFGHTCVCYCFNSHYWAKNGVQDEAGACQRAEPARKLDPLFALLFFDCFRRTQTNMIGLSRTTRQGTNFFGASEAYAVRRESRSANKTMLKVQICDSALLQFNHNSGSTTDISSAYQIYHTYKNYEYISWNNGEATVNSLLVLPFRRCLSGFVEKEAYA
jgi:hypothetical protein